MKPPFKAPQLFAPAFEIVTALTSPAEPMDIRRSTPFTWRDARRVMSYAKVTFSMTDLWFYDVLWWLE